MGSAMDQRGEAEVSSDPRVDLAVERTELALERTQLAWIRTMLTIITAGIAIDKGLEFIHEQTPVTNMALAQNGHIIGIAITSFGIILLLTESIRFAKRSRQLAQMKKSKYSLFSAHTALSVMVILIGFALIYLMLTTG
jgi:uncharacterized membrane protein YidH (DUF202 family)